mmetsp:Transcript_4480/g.5729  ORF Transcript_4480/g.5729 Transcript_4480/m.5729 type:complete len:90 (-) Transcript_4480:1993-2262(-)
MGGGQSVSRDLLISPDDSTDVTLCHDPRRRVASGGRGAVDGGGDAVSLTDTAGPTTAVRDDGALFGGEATFANMAPTAFDGGAASALGL